MKNKTGKTYDMVVINTCLWALVFLLFYWLLFGSVIALLLLVLFNRFLTPLEILVLGFSGSFLINALRQVFSK